MPAVNRQDTLIRVWFRMWVETQRSYKVQHSYGSKAEGMRLSRDWGSCRDGCWRMRIVGGWEALPEAGAEHDVVDGAADLEQQVLVAVAGGHPPFEAGFAISGLIAASMRPSHRGAGTDCHAADR